MKKLNGRICFLLGLMIMFNSGTVPIKAEEAAVRPEVRAVWVDAFHDGIKTPQQVDQLIKDCLAANINTLIVQVRRRGDAYYNQSFEPRTEDPKLASEFDALQYLIDQAHTNQLEVHAWLNTLVAWNKTTPPQDPNHVWNLHGPQAQGEANWVSYYRKYDPKKRRWSERLLPSYFLDPGNPAALDYTVAVYLNVVKNYDVDGIHLDYTRYEALGWGYNQTNVARYNARYGTTGLPRPDDPRWLQWRREQTANLVRKVYLKTIALKPKVKVSSAVITWGDGPVSEAGWKQTRAYVDVGQDWRGWLQEGIIDLVVPMNYFPEWNSIKKRRYDQWIEWEKDHQYGRQIVIGPGLFSQYIEQSLEQIRRAQAPSAKGNRAAGVALYAYGWNNLYSNDDYRNPANAKALPRQPHVFLPDSNNWLFKLLSQAGSYWDPALKREIRTEPVFPVPAPIPDLPWKSNPTKGYLMGTITGPDGKAYDGLQVIVESVGTAEPPLRRMAVTDGSGWYGMAELPPGEYRVLWEHPDFKEPQQLEVTVTPGLVCEANF